MTRAYYLKHRDRILNEQRGYHLRNRAKRNAKARDNSFVRRYGITTKERDLLIVRQKNRCAICGSLFTETNRPEVDHCHSTGRVRGMLCTFCNSMLGYAKDSQLNLRNAQKYLADSQGNLITFS